MAAKFVLKKAVNGEFHFNLLATNGEIILTSETYKAKPGALNGIESVRTNAPDDKRYQRKESGDQFYFVLKAANHQVIGRSERYTTAKSMEKGIASVMKNAPGAKVDDQTA
jgi:uncharacterized protein YegP (UPF0339 family)